MNILILCTYFPPDTAIGAVRPHMIAKYMMQRGHRVTVLRSGVINRSADRFFVRPEGLEVISYLGADSAAERFERGDSEVPVVKRPSKIERLPRGLQKPVGKLYHWLTEPLRDRALMRQAKCRFEAMKEVIDTMADSQFDVVFATYGELENIYGGIYAKQRLGCKLVMDFRDLPVQVLAKSWWLNQLMRKPQREAIRHADLITTVSQGLSNHVQNSPCKVVTLYNGFEGGGEVIYAPHKGLRFCYTGLVYSYRTQALAAFCEIVKELISQGSIEADAVKFVYAGASSDVVNPLFERMGLMGILENHGLVDRTEANRLQNESDLFVVLSWNTKTEQGILTGKFYEGIRANKPILSVVAGNQAESELYLLNQQYHYGCCYEVCQRDQQQESFKSFLVDQYGKALRGELAQYRSPEPLKQAFDYKYLTLQLEEEIQNVID